ncbi:response regulator transcription factor [Streptomyces sp. NBC_01136]|uniref:LuxR C-terminal-related transcriptional regulator n=1 Tax=unclassified Streptomyces TaxID=2593676 RepID=UPI0032527E86|nr:response regulator transcription factor [Streptomyces sp. NBC_01136]WST81164.1 response regulator transcription factor [Streptomyces sp. NBC_01136]
MSQMPAADPATRSIRVAVLAGRPLLVTALRTVLAGEPELEAAGEAGSRAQLLRLLDATEPQVVLIDDSDPGWETVDILRAVLGHTSRRIAVVVLIGQGVDDAALEYLWAGADGLVPHDAALSEIAAAIRAASAGHAVLPPPLTRRLVDLLVRRVPAQAAPPRVSTLTSREREIFDLIAAGMSNNEVARALVLSEKTVKFHVSNLLRKLGVRNRAQAIVWAWDQGVLSGRQGGAF